MPNQPQQDPNKVDPKQDPQNNDPRKSYEKFTADSYLAALEKQKKNSVPKEEYEHLKEEHEKLIQSLVDNKDIVQQDKTKVVEEVKIPDLMKKILTDKNLTNLEYVKSSLELRDKMLKEGKPDIFVPKGPKVQYNPNDYAAAERVAKELQDCVDQANGDSVIFNQVLRAKLR